VADALAGIGFPTAKYEPLRRFAVGGMGEIFLARQRGILGFERLVVLKQLLPQWVDRPDTVAMFIDEARVWAHLSHPNIVHVHEFGQEQKCYYLAMEYVPGQNLAALCSRLTLQNRQLELGSAIYIVLQVARALDYAHQRGVLHRDIKPGNILIDRDQKPWLIDFGLAKVMRLGDPAYLKGIILGTPYYMAPEQAIGDMELVDAQSDIYSLGAVLYELLCGVYPFAGMKSDLVFAELLPRAPDPLEQIDPAVPAELCRIVKTAMAREKKNRYSRAGEFAEEVDDYLKSLG